MTVFAYDRKLNENPLLDRVVEISSMEVDTIPIEDGNIGMTVYHSSTDFIWNQPDYTGSMMRLEVFSMLTGDLANGNYYQTYFQFPSKTQPGTYESFTCTTKYTMGDSYSSDFQVSTYQGE